MMCARFIHYGDFLVRQRLLLIGLLTAGLLAPVQASPAEAQEAPAAEDAEERLMNSPRHGEWVGPPRPTARRWGVAATHYTW